MSIDFHEVTELSRDLGKIPARVVPTVTAIAKRGAQNVMEEMRSDAESDGHSQHFSGSITYDRTVGGFGSIEFEIGPDKRRRQGALGNLLYFGSAKNAPTLDIDGPLKREEPRFIAELAKGIEEAMKL